MYSTNFYHAQYDCIECQATISDSSTFIISTRRKNATYSLILYDCIRTYECACLWKCSVIGERVNNIFIVKWKCLLFFVCLFMPRHMMWCVCFPIHNLHTHTQQVATKKTVVNQRNSTARGHQHQRTQHFHYFCFIFCIFKI